VMNQVFDGTIGRLPQSRAVRVHGAGANLARAGPPPSVDRAAETGRPGLSRW
jgi:hypothetical protein